MLKNFGDKIRLIRDILLGRQHHLLRLLGRGLSIYGGMVEKLPFSIQGWLLIQKNSRRSAGSIFLVRLTDWNPTRVSFFNI